MFPFLYPQFVFVIPGQLYETKYPIVAILSTNGKMPKEINTSQLRCIGHCSNCPRFDDSTDTNNLTTWLFSDYLDRYYKNLPNLTALVNYKKVTDLRKLEKCKISSQLTSLNLSRCPMIGNCPDGNNPDCSFHHLQELDTTMRHLYGAVHLPDLKNLPELKNLKKLTLRLSDTKKGLRDFKSNQFKFLKYLNVLSGSPTDTSYYRFGLPDTSCLRRFKSNATRKQVRFTVFGTEDANGVFIPGNDNWVKKLRKVKVLEDFYWLVQTEKYVFEKRCFNDVPLRKGVVIKHYYAETENRDTDSDQDDSDIGHVLSSDWQSEWQQYLNWKPLDTEEPEDDSSSDSDIEEFKYVPSSDSETEDRDTEETADDRSFGSDTEETADDSSSDSETEDPPSDSEPEWLPHEWEAIEYDENRFIEQQKKNRKKQLQKQSKK